MSCYDIPLTITDAVARLDRATAFGELLGPPACFAEIDTVANTQNHHGARARRR